MASSAPTIRRGLAVRCRVRARVPRRRESCRDRLRIPNDDRRATPPLADPALLRENAASSERHCLKAYDARSPECLLGDWSCVESTALGLEEPADCRDQTEGPRKMGTCAAPTKSGREAIVPLLALLLHGEV